MENTEEADCEEEEDQPTYILYTGPLEEMSKKDLIQLCRNLESIIQRKEEEIERANKHMEYILGLYYETEAKLAEKRKEVLDYKARGLAASLLGPGSVPGDKSSLPAQQQQQQQAEHHHNGTADPETPKDCRSGEHLTGHEESAPVNGSAGIPGEDNDEDTNSASYTEDSGSEDIISDECESESGSSVSGSDTKAEPTHAEDGGNGTGSKVKRRNGSEPEVKTSHAATNAVSPRAGKGSLSKDDNGPVNVANPTRMSAGEPDRKRRSVTDMEVDDPVPGTAHPPGTTARKQNNNNVLASPVEARAKPLHERTSCNFSSDMTRIPVAIERSKSPSLSKRCQRRQAKSISITSRSAQPVLNRRGADQFACSMPAAGNNSPVSGWIDGQDTVGDQLPPRPKPRPRPRMSQQGPLHHNGRPQTARGADRQLVEVDPALLRHSISCPQTGESTQPMVLKFHSELSDEVIMEMCSPPPARCSTPTDRYSSLANDSPNGFTPSGSMTFSPHPPRTPPTPTSGSPLPHTTRCSPRPHDVASTPPPVVERFSPHPPTDHAPLPLKPCQSPRRSSPYPLNTSRTPIEYSSLAVSSSPGPQPSSPVGHRSPQPMNVSTPLPLGMHSPIPPAVNQSVPPKTLPLAKTVDYAQPEMSPSSPVTRSPRPVNVSPSPLMYSPPPVISKLSPSASTNFQPTATGDTLSLRHSAVVGSMMPDSLELDDTVEDSDAEGELVMKQETETEEQQPSTTTQSGTGEQGIVSNILDSLLVKLGSPESLTHGNES